MSGAPVKEGTMNDRLAALLHEAMPDEHNWHEYFRREDEPDGWSLVITRKLSEHLARYLTAVGVRLADEPAPPGLREAAQAVVLSVRKMTPEIAALNAALAAATPASPAPEAEGLRADVERLLLDMGAHRFDGEHWWVNVPEGWFARRADILIGRAATPPGEARPAEAAAGEGEP